MKRSGYKKKKKQPVKNRGYKYLAIPLFYEAVLFDKTIGSCRWMYNHMLSDRTEAYKERHETINPLPSSYKQYNEWLKEVDSTALVNVHMNINSAFELFFKKKGKYPKFKSKHRSKQSYTSNNVNNSIRIEGDKIRLPKVGWVRLKMHRPLPKDALIKTVTVSKENGKYYISICVEEPDSKTKKTVDQTNAIGLDYASDGLYVDSNGERCDMPKYYRRSEKRLRRSQRHLSRKVLHSNSWHKQNKRVNKIHSKVRNQRKDFLHKESKHLSETYDIIGVEDIDMKAMSQCLKLGKNTMDNGYGMFRNMLSYKLEEKGKVFIKIDKFFPSSQLCHKCKTKHSITKDLKVRHWTCPTCGAEHDRDINAALNIKEEALRIFLT